jgi:hypothetical protein
MYVTETSATKSTSDSDKGMREASVARSVSNSRRSQATWQYAGLLIRTGSLSDSLRLRSGPRSSRSWGLPRTMSRFLCMRSG